MRNIETTRTAVLLCLSCALACGGGRTPLRSSAAVDSGSPGNSEAAWDGSLLAPTPGVVRCGPIFCHYGYECCLNDDGSPAGCDLRSTARCLGKEYPSRVCDETADCHPGELCCVGAPTNGWRIGAYCEVSGTTSPLTSCAVWGEHTACGSDDDCRALSAPPCVAQRCRGDILQTCGPLPADWCPQ